MANAFVPTWAEVNTYIALVAIGLAFFVYAWVKGKREEERTATWVADWN